MGGRWRRMEVELHKGLAEQEARGGGLKVPEASENSSSHQNQQDTQVKSNMSLLSPFQQILKDSY